MAKTLFDPFGFLTGDPFKELLQMQRDMFKLFDQFLGTVPTPRAAKDPGKAPPQAAEETGWKPVIETVRKDDNLIIKCSLPGVEPGDIDVSFDESTNQLDIKGERKQNGKAESGEPQQSHKFELLFTVPTGIKPDLMKGKYSNGILEITVPTTAEIRPRKAQLKTAPASPKVRKTAKKAA